MIILHFTGKGQGMMNGVSEVVYLYADEDDLPDNLGELCPPGMRLNKKYDTEYDQITSLPLGEPLLRKL